VLANSSGFNYAVSVTGVTGAALDVDDAQCIKEPRRAARREPAAAGRRVRRALAAGRAGARAHADGVVVGTALIEAGQRGPAALGELVAAMRAATKR
jgi:tryptophan synthase alpha chain